MRVAMIGGESTGKTTLARSLAQGLGAPVTTEVLRDFVEEQGRTPRREEQESILLRQWEREQAIADARLAICDPATLMTAVYSFVYFGDTSLDAQAIAHCADYALLIWCRPDIPWTPEPGQHDGPELRRLADSRIAELLHEYRLPCCEVRGDPATRLRTARAAIVALG